MNTITSLNLHNNIGRKVEENIDKEISAFSNLKLEDIEVTIDKLFIQFNGDLNIEALLSKNYRQGSTRSSQYYQKRILFTSKNNKRRKINYFENSRNSSDYRHKIELNPRHFKNYQSLYFLIKTILSAEALRGHRISRVDISYRFPSGLISVESFFLSSYFEDKHLVGIYSNSKEKIEPNLIYRSGKLQTVVIGKTPYRISIYDQSLKKKSAEQFINFEIQLSDGKVKEMLNIESFFDLVNLGQSDPLYKIHFFKITQVQNKSSLIGVRTNRRLDVFTELQVLSLKSGFHTARSLLNKEMNRKFDEDIMKNLSVLRIHDRSSLKKAMNKKFQIDMSNYFSD